MGGTRQALMVQATRTAAEVRSISAGVRVRAQAGTQAAAYPVVQQAQAYIYRLAGSTMEM